MNTEAKTIQYKTEKIKKCSQIDKKTKSVLIKNFLSNMDNETKFKFWIKTLLSTYNTIPEIIQTVDKIIELQASTVSFSSDVFNGKNSLMNQVESLIDLSQRKNSLLNIYIMTKELVKNLSEDDIDFIEKKFMYNWSIEDLSKEFNISIRTTYRRIDKLVNIIYSKATSKNWSLRFIESQIKNENWIKEKFIKIVSDYFKNLNYQYKIENGTCSKPYVKLPSELEKSVS